MLVAVWPLPFAPANDPGGDPRGAVVAALVFLPLLGRGRRMDGLLSPSLLPPECLLLGGGGLFTRLGHVRAHARRHCRQLLAAQVNGTSSAGSAFV